MLNNLKTFALLGLLTALFGGAGYLIGGTHGMIIALLIAAVMNIVSWWYSDRLILKLYGAKPIRMGGVYHITRELAKKSNIPMPRLYLIEQAQPNAFATGRNPQHAAIAVTSGLLDILSPRELKAVLAHEIAHIKNRDTLTMTATAVIAGALSMLANFMILPIAGQNRNAGGAIAFVTALFAPLAALLVQAAISRTREYEADRIGAKICGDPLALASALQRLDMVTKHVDNDTAEQHPATAHMFIVNPLHVQSAGYLFATHPPAQKRVRVLKSFALHGSGQNDRYDIGLPRGTRRA